MSNPPSYNQPPYSQPPAAWPPTPNAPEFAPAPFENTSGTEGPLPPEVARCKFSWGAFSLAPFWLLAHRMIAGGILLLVAIVSLEVLTFTVNRMIGLVGYLFWFFYLYLGFQGHKLAWRHRRYDSLEHFFVIETAWKNWAIGLMIVGAVLGALGVVLAIVAGTMARHF